MAARLGAVPVPSGAAGRLRRGVRRARRGAVASWLGRQAVTSSPGAWAAGGPGCSRR